MEISMRRCTLFLVILSLTLSVSASVDQLEWTSGETKMKGEAEGVLHLEIRDRATGLTQTIELPHLSKIVDDVRLIGPNRILVTGRMNPEEERAGTVTIIDRQSGKIVDSFRTLDATIAPSGDMMAYKWLPPRESGGTAFLSSILVYRFAASPESNRIPGISAYHGSGTVLYPEENRIGQRYFAVLGEEGWLSGCRPRRSFVSPIAWSSDSKRIAVVEFEAGDQRIVVIDVSSGVAQPEISTIRLHREDFLREEFGRRIPEDYPRDLGVAFRRIEFTADGKQIVLESWPLGPWSDKTLSVPASQ